MNYGSNTVHVVLYRVILLRQKVQVLDHFADLYKQLTSKDLYL